MSLQHKDQSTKRRAKSDPKGSNAPEVPLKGHAGGHFLRSAPKKTLCGKKYATVLTYWVWGSNGLVVFFLGGGFGLNNPRSSPIFLQAKQSWLLTLYRLAQGCYDRPFPDPLKDRLHTISQGVVTKIGYAKYPFGGFHHMHG